MPLGFWWKFAGSVSLLWVQKPEQLSGAVRIVHTHWSTAELTHYLKTATICQDFVLQPFELGPEYFLRENEVRKFIHQLWLTDIWIGHSLIWTINLCFHKITLQKNTKSMHFQRLTFTEFIEERASEWKEFLHHKRNLITSSSSNDSTFP